MDQLSFAFVRQDRADTFSHFISSPVTRCAIIIMALIMEQPSEHNSMQNMKYKTLAPYRLLHLVVFCTIFRVLI